MKNAVVALILAALMATACSSDPDAEPPVAEPTAVPAEPTEPVAEPGPVLVEGSGDLGDLVGTEFDERSMPLLLAPDPIGGAALINLASDPEDARLVGLFWAVRDGTANFALTGFVRRDAEGVPRWRITSTWLLRFDPGTLVSVGSHICVAPADAYDPTTSIPISVTTATADRALAAWIMTPDGPLDYPDVAAIRCEPIDAPPSP